MILDASVIVAIVRREEGYRDLLARLEAADGLGIGAPTLAEAGIVLAARLKIDARTVLDRFLSDFGVAVVPFGEDHWREAMAAWSRFGKGRHRAALNFGDCLCYATARLSGRPLLCTGDDFRRTDLDIA